MSESNDDMFGRRHFEAFISAPPFDHMCDRSGPEAAWPGQYKRYETQIAWEAWQAAVALVRAAMSERTDSAERAPETCSLYKWAAMWDDPDVPFGGVVYRDLSPVKTREGIMAHRAANFVRESEAEDYCRYRNLETVKNGSDAVELIRHEPAAKPAGVLDNRPILNKGTPDDRA